MFEINSPGVRAELKVIPFIQRYSTVPCNGTRRDEETHEEPLSESAVMSSAGLTTARGTRMTAVRQETTDDD